MPLPTRLLDLAATMSMRPTDAIGWSTECRWNGSGFDVIVENDQGDRAELTVDLPNTIESKDRILSWASEIVLDARRKRAARTTNNPTRGSR